MRRLKTVWWAFLACVGCGIATVLLYFLIDLLMGIDNAPCALNHSCLFEVFRMAAFGVIGILLVGFGIATIWWPIRIVWDDWR